jgi:DNA mismatch endonuclease (patch repair protein)
MGAVRRRNTEPELAFRKELRRLGVQFRIHDHALPGTPDVVLPERRLAIFVHGCFWHRHRDCPRSTMPKSNRQFWLVKFRGNLSRDARKARQLRAAGWSVCTVWACRLERAAAAEAKRVLRVGSRAPLPARGSARDQEELSW